MRSSRVSCKYNLYCNSQALWSRCRDSRDNGTIFRFRGPILFKARLSARPMRYQGFLSPPFFLDQQIVGLYFVGIMAESLGRRCRWNKPPFQAGTLVPCPWDTWIRASVIMLGPNREWRYNREQRSKREGDVGGLRPFEIARTTMPSAKTILVGKSLWWIGGQWCACLTVPQRGSVTVGQAIVNNFSHFILLHLRIFQAITNIDLRSSIYISP
jgi:hypothetical protein